MSETAFTTRMRQVCDDASARCPGYNPTRFRQMIDASGGDFLPAAKTMLLSGVIQKGLWTLARHGALDVAMESVILEDQWKSQFTEDERVAASWRLAEAQRMVDAGEAPPASW